MLYLYTSYCIHLHFTAHDRFVTHTAVSESGLRAHGPEMTGYATPGSALYRSINHCVKDNVLAPGADLSVTLNGMRLTDEEVITLLREEMEGMPYADLFVPFLALLGITGIPPLSPVEEDSRSSVPPAPRNSSHIIQEAF